jgi:hypothetical protein
MVIADVRRGANGLDSVPLGLKGHGHRVVHLFGPVVEPREDVAMKVYHRPRNGTLRAPR